MKRVTRLFMLILMVMLLTFGSIACNRQSGVSEPSAGSTGSQQPQSGQVPKVELPEGGHVKAVEKLPPKPLRFAFLCFQNNPFWFPIRDGAKAATEYLRHFNTTVDYIVMGDDLKADKVVAAIETAIAKKYDGIVVSPFADGTETAIDKAVDAGIPVVTIIGESSKPSKRLTFIGQDAVAAGELAGKIMAEHMGGTGKIGIITGNLHTVQHEQRRKGAEDYLKKNYPNIQIIGVWEAHDKAELTYNIARDMISAHPDLKMIYCTAGGPFGAAKAIQDLKKTGQIGVVCYDWVPENVKYVKSGEIIAAISQDPFGMAFDSLVVLYNYIVGGIKPDPVIRVKQDVLTPQNVNEKIREHQL
ncbi:MAG: sugar ABC transporter substrate-binding protein [Thermoanaerobacteraceae bacterium]|nr:sugar ABC transporter substrate-binding protein [Thermoanaerobacteraceae bacterium]